jgi:hypothetical protein
LQHREWRRTFPHTGSAGSHHIGLDSCKQIWALWQFVSSHVRTLLAFFFEHIQIIYCFSLLWRQLSAYLTAYTQVLISGNYSGLFNCLTCFFIFS